MNLSNQNKTKQESIKNDLLSGRQNAYEKREYFREVLHKAIIHEECFTETVARHQTRYWNEIYEHLTEVDYITRNLNLS